MNKDDAYKNAYPLVAGLVDRQMLACRPVIELYSSRFTEKQHLQYIAFVLGVIENHCKEELSVLVNEFKLTDFLIYYEDKIGGGLLYHWKEMIVNETFHRERSLGYDSVNMITESNRNPEDVSKEYLIKALNINV